MESVAPCWDVSLHLCTFFSESSNRWHFRQDCAILFMLQAQADVVSTKNDWSRIVNQLSPDPLDNLSDGECIIQNALDQIKGLQEEQSLAFEDLASKDEALANAEDKIGQNRKTLMVHILHMFVV